MSQYYSELERGYETIENGLAMVGHRDPGRNRNTNPYYMTMLAIPAGIVKKGA